MNHVAEEISGRTSHRFHQRDCIGRWTGYLNEAIQVAFKIPPGRLGCIEVRPIQELEVHESRRHTQEAVTVAPSASKRHEQVQLLDLRETRSGSSRARTRCWITRSAAGASSLLPQDLRHQAVRTRPSG